MITQFFQSHICRKTAVDECLHSMFEATFCCSKWQRNHQYLNWSQPFPQFPKSKALITTLAITQFANRINGRNQSTSLFRGDICFCWKTQRLRTASSTQLAEMQSKFSELRNVDNWTSKLEAPGELFRVNANSCLYHFLMKRVFNWWKRASEAFVNS